MVEKPEEYEHEGATIGIFGKPWAGITLILDYITCLRKECDDQRVIFAQNPKKLKIETESGSERRNEGIRETDSHTARCYQ